MEEKKLESQIMEMLYETYQARLFAVIYRFIKRYKIAEEVAQDAWINIVRDLRQRHYQLPEKVEAWLCTIARNQAQKFLCDKAKKEQYESIDQLLLGGHDFEGRDPDQPEYVVLQSATYWDLATIVNGLLFQLPTAEFAAAWAVLVEKYSYQEAATFLDMTTNAVGVAVSRAKRKLQRLFHDLGDTCKRQGWFMQLFGEALENSS